ncbi:MAG: S1 family peptidase [Myxococcota bacterium]|nr:S1 family peptidase [Myxococcota bacterium]
MKRMCGYFLSFVMAGLWPVEVAFAQKIGQVQSAIVNGSREPRAVGLSVEEQLSIGWVSNFKSPLETFCTGTLITSRVVLTAKHCFRNTPPADMPFKSANEISFGLGARPELAEFDFDVERIILHPEDSNDAALLVLKDDVVKFLEEQTRGVSGIDNRVKPIQFNRYPIDGEQSEALAGLDVEVAGFGNTQDENLSGRFFATVKFLGVDPENPQFIVIDGEQKAGVCDGDSGGPLFARNQRGQPVVMGVLFGGEKNCRGIDFMTRTDTIATWIDDQIRSTWTPTDEGGHCADLDYQGRCNGDIVEWCNENFQLQRKDCVPLNAVCTFVNEEKGYWCGRPDRCSVGGYCGNPVEGFIEVGPISAAYVGACDQSSPSTNTIWLVSILGLWSVIRRRRQRDRG